MQKGDVVWLKSGGEKVTVSRVIDDQIEVLFWKDGGIVTRLYPAIAFHDVENEEKGLEQKPDRQEDKVLEQTYASEAENGQEQADLTSFLARVAHRLKAEQEDLKAKVSSQPIESPMPENTTECEEKDPSQGSSEVIPEEEVFTRDFWQRETDPKTVKSAFVSNFKSWDSAAVFWDNAEDENLPDAECCVEQDFPNLTEKSLPHWSPEPDTSAINLLRHTQHLGDRRIVNPTIEEIRADEAKVAAGTHAWMWFPYKREDGRIDSIRYAAERRFHFPSLGEALNAVKNGTYEWKLAMGDDPPQVEQWKPAPESWTESDILPPKQWKPVFILVPKIEISQEPCAFRQQRLFAKPKPLIVKQVDCAEETREDAKEDLL